MGILSSQTVIKNTINELHLQVVVEDISSFPERPVYKDRFFNIGVDSVSKLFWDVPFIISQSNNPANDLRVEIEGEIGNIVGIKEFYSLNEKVITGMLDQNKDGSIVDDVQRLAKGGLLQKVMGMFKRK